MAASDIGAKSELVTRCRPPGVDITQQLHLGSRLESTPSRLLPRPGRPSRICPANGSHLLCFCYIRLLTVLKVTKLPPAPATRPLPLLLYCTSLSLSSTLHPDFSQCLPSWRGWFWMALPIHSCPSSAPSTSHTLKGMGSNLSSAILPAR